MANKTRQDRVRQGGAQSGIDHASDGHLLEHLRQSFEAFRRERRPGTHVPKVLREQVLAALGGGAPKREVLRACGISSWQVDLWRRGRRSHGQALQLQEHTARVFPVIDDTSEVEVERASDHRAQNLQLRIGGWVVCIRQDR